MFKKISKFLFSMSLAAVTAGAGFLCLGKVGKTAIAENGNSITVAIGGQSYSLKANKYGNETFYVIETPEDLALVSYMVSVVKDPVWARLNFELKNDINLSSKLWTAIGTYDNPFAGKFNGNGFTINGLNAAKDAVESEVFYEDESTSSIF